MVVFAQNVQRCVTRDGRIKEEERCAKEVRELTQGSSCR